MHIRQDLSMFAQSNYLDIFNLHQFAIAMYRQIL
jgi:hypothetical protein